ncbi:hypothetical protein FHS70_004668 [Flammeovirga yaeyamensis]|nr:hypothetical protein [Flammeovirga yaeyamensis]
MKKNRKILQSFVNELHFDSSRLNLVKLTRLNEGKSNPNSSIF